MFMNEAPNPAASRRPYQKPVILVESLTMASTIAADCLYIATDSENTYIDRADAGTVYTVDENGQIWQGEVKLETFCYNGPINQVSLHSS